MYLEYFGLREFPFSLAPDPRFLYLSPQHREALAHLLYGVCSEGGFVQLTGEVGTGKTTVCRCFLEQLPAGTHAAVILNPALSAEELFATICDEFRIARPEGPASVQGSLDLINRFLLRVHAAGERAVLVIDEAQVLGAAVLEQVRLLTNLETSSHKLLQIILMGQPELRATLERPELRQLAQRITARFHLRPLTQEETRAYVKHRLAVAGSGEELFPAAVIGRLRRLSRGIPRLINILCDRALLGTFVQGKRQVERATLAQAAREVAGEVAKTRVPLAAAAVLAVCLAAALVFALAGRRQPERPTARSGAPPAATVPRPQARPRVSGVLRALMEQPEAQQQNEAWGWLYRLWGIRATGGENGCALALVHGLDCLRGEGGLEQLRRLNRPAIVRLYDQDGQPRWLVLESLAGRQVTLAAGGARTVVDIDKLAGYDIREFVLLWRPPVRTRGTLAAGDHGAGVAWLLQRLGTVRGVSQDAAPDPVFDAGVTAAVRAFQLAAGIVGDGVAGPETLILLRGHRRSQEASEGVLHPRRAEEIRAGASRRPDPGSVHGARAPAARAARAHPRDRYGGAASLDRVGCRVLVLAGHGSPGRGCGPCPGGRRCASPRGHRRSAGDPAPGRRARSACIKPCRGCAAGVAPFRRGATADTCPPRTDAARGGGSGPRPAGSLVGAAVRGHRGARARAVGGTRADARTRRAARRARRFDIPRDASADAGCGRRSVGRSSGGRRGAGRHLVRVGAGGGSGGSGAARRRARARSGRSPGSGARRASEDARFRARLVRGAVTEAVERRRPASARGRRGRGRREPAGDHG
jgi:general secretion pathway protein A